MKKCLSLMSLLTLFLWLAIGTNVSTFAKTTGESYTKATSQVTIKLRSGSTSEVTPPNSDNPHSDNSKSGRLPQTGEVTAGLVAFLGTFLLGMISWLWYKKNRQEARADVKK